MFNAAGRSPYVMDIETHKMKVALTEHHDEHYHRVARLNRFYLFGAYFWNFGANC